MPSLFYPKKSSAHRTACKLSMNTRTKLILRPLGIALYRALLSHTASLQLPAESLRVTIDPIKHLIRKQFRRNQHLMSPRLIVTALKIGYEVSRPHSSNYHQPGAQRARRQRIFSTALRKATKLHTQRFSRSCKSSKRKTTPSGPSGPSNLTHHDRQSHHDESPSHGPGHDPFSKRGHGHFRS